MAIKFAPPAHAYHSVTRYCTTMPRYHPCNSRASCYFVATLWVQWTFRVGRGAREGRGKLRLSKRVSLRMTVITDRGKRFVHAGYRTLHCGAVELFSHARFVRTRTSVSKVSCSQAVGVTTVKYRHHDAARGRAGILIDILSVYVWQGYKCRAKLDANNHEFVLRVYVMKLHGIDRGESAKLRKKQDDELWKRYLIESRSDRQPFCRLKPRLLE